MPVPKKTGPVPIRTGSAVKVKGPDPVPIRSGSFRIRGPKTGTGLPGSGSVPIRFGPNIRSDRFQRTGALFLTVGLTIFRFRIFHITVALFLTGG